MAAPAALSPRSRIAVASEQTLVAEAVRAALAGQGYDVVVLRWPTAAASGPLASVPALVPRSQPGVLPPDLAVLLSDLDRPSRIREARYLVDRLRVPWLVLAGSEPGPAWGAMLDIGVASVVPTSTTLDELLGLLGDLTDERPMLAEERRRELLQQWQEHRRRRLQAAAGLESLTAREAQVLHLLHAGESVRDIAAHAEVSEATVRSQVKAVLRKLDVNTQLAAVAAYEMLLDDESDARLGRS